MRAGNQEKQPVEKEAKLSILYQSDIKLGAIYSTPQGGKVIGKRPAEGGKGSGNATGVGMVKLPSSDVDEMTSVTLSVLSPTSPRTWRMPYFTPITADNVSALVFKSPPLHALASSKLSCTAIPSILVGLNYQGMLRGQDDPDPRPTPPHSKILLSDLGGFDILTILQQYQPLEPNTGAVDGRGRRILFPFETTIQGKTNLVGYLFDTGSSITTILLSDFARLWPDVDAVEGEGVLGRVGTDADRIRISIKGFKGVSILGMNWLDQGEMSVRPGVPDARSS